MIILPVGHEQKTVRRWPWVTFGIIALCFVVFMAERAASQGGEEQMNALFEEVMVYYFERPYLKLDRELMALAFSTTPESEEEVAEALRGIGNGHSSPPPGILRREQQRLDEMAKDLLAQIHARPLFRWGHVPMDFKPLTLLTYMFLHAGWLHLLGNLFYLYLTAPFIEDVWGRPVFTVFYLICGVVAAVLYSAQYPHLSVPLIGASGAVAGIMGAFMVRYARTRITFVYFAWFLRVFAGTFQAPAMIMLLLWVGGELLSAYLADWMAPGSGGSGVAHWAHVWGFGFGALGAVLVGALKIEEKHRRRTAGDDLENTVVEQAHQAAAEGHRAEAWSLLAEEVRRRPSNRDAALALWDLGMTLERTGEAAPAFARVIREELGEGEAELALFHWRELCEREPDFAADPGLRLKLAETLWRDGDGAEAEELVRRAASDLDGSAGAGIVLRLARLGTAIDPALGAEVARAALKRTAPPPELKLELEELGAASGAPPSLPAGVAPLTVAPPAPLDAGVFGFGEMPEALRIPSPAPVPWTLRVLEGEPRELTGEVLALRMESGETARLRLASIRALAVAAVRESGARHPVLVIDLFLDTPAPPAATTRGLRVVRCLSRSFDPRKLLSSNGAGGEGDVKRAFQELIGRLLAASGAAPLLGSDRFGRQPMKVYPSLASYQAALSQ